MAAVNHYGTHEYKLIAKFFGYVDQPGAAAAHCEGHLVALTHPYGPAMASAREFMALFGFDLVSF